MKNKMPIITENIIEEILSKRYIKICQENKMCFNDYINTCKEESLKIVLLDEPKKQIKRIYKKQNKLSKNVILHKPKLSFKE
tara:strand:+ start:5129 stop:5374 length:246 start_codon:yes stop_codon:yes gene_type:complete